MSARRGICSWQTIVAVLALTFAYRVLALETIAMGSDAFDRWWWMRLELNGIDPLKVNHHTARLAITALLKTVMFLFGSHPLVYYALPVALSTAVSLLVYVVALRVTRSKAGAWAATLLVASMPLLRSEASNLTPGLFSAMFLMLAIYCLMVGYFETAQTRYRQVIAAALCIFLAYQSKETDVFVMPGLLAAMLYFRRDWRAIGVFAGVPAVLFAIETLAYRLYTDFPLGRIQIIQKEHLSHHFFSEPMAPLDLIARYGNLLPSTLLFFAAAAVGGVVLWRQRQVSPTASALIFACLSYFLFMTLGVKSIDPLKPAFRILDRYFVAIAPMLGILAVSAVTGSRPPDTESGGRRPWRWVTIVGIGACLLLFLGSAGLFISEAYKYGHPVQQVIAGHSLLNRAFDENTPILASHDGQKTLKLVRAIHLDDRHVLPAPGVVTFPTIRKIRTVHGKYTILDKYGSHPLSPSDLTSRCHIFLESTSTPSQSGRYFSLVPRYCDVPPDNKDQKHES